MAIRNIYLKIEEILDYSPVEPSAHAAANYRRDCMRNPGHEDGTIPLSEVDARRLNALIYREYLDPGYLIPKPDKLVLTDINEPIYAHRVPGTVIYARPGDHLHIRVLNGDSMPHSFHVHGLRYGIDSDGSWPLGTQSTDGRRSDEICPGQFWLYHFTITEQMVGAWPFHDHSRHIGESVNRGLFGGIVVLPGDCEHPRHMELPPMVAGYLKRKSAESSHDHHDEVAPAAPADAAGHDHGGGHGEHGSHLPGMEVDFDLRAQRDFLEEWSQLEYAHHRPEPAETLHVPVFFHSMSKVKGAAAFNKSPFSPGDPPFEVIFGTAGTFGYHCEIHTSMQGTVVVEAGGLPEAVVAIIDTDPMNMRFSPAEVHIQPGGKVRWTAGTVQTHTITENGAGLPSYCLNGRSFIGNTPTILAHSGQKIRWYVFNLDLSMGWHNFHVHAQRWQFANETVDTRSIGPAESFVVETVAPPVILLPVDIEAAQEPHHRPKHARAYHLRGDFLFHCHVEMHMMQGLAGLVRARQTVWLTPEQAKKIAAESGLPLDHGGNTCPVVDETRCEVLNCGKWELVPGATDVCMMHAALLPNTQRVLLFGYGDTRDDLSRVWDYSTPAGSFMVPPNQPFDVTLPVHSRPLANIWSAEHAFINDAQGTLLVHGGFTPRESFLFSPATLQWSRVPPTAEERFYSSTLTLADGRLMTLFGSGSKSIEIYDPGTSTWAAPIPFPPSMAHHQYYPWTYLLPSGKLFIAGPHVPTQRFDWNPAVANVESFPTIAGNRSTGGERATSVLLPLRPPAYVPRVLIAGGDPALAQQTAEIIDLSVTTPVWTALPNLNRPRMHQVNTVLLPDGRVMLAGGIDAADGGPAELFDPRNPAAGWELCATMSIPRGYHSAAILLADGSVLMGGDRPGAWKSGETTAHERYFPWYYSLARPTITAAPASVAYGTTFDIQTPSPAAIAEVVLLRPGAVTHGWNQSQRYVECAITGGTAAAVRVQAPPNGKVAPPGHYLLFILTAGRVPSHGRWIRVS
ncbi:MAG: galactose oxidase-like domain-containing protein [Steroidobacteraceae bacterium]